MLRQLRILRGKFITRSIIQAISDQNFKERDGEEQRRELRDHVSYQKFAEFTIKYLGCQFLRRHKTDPEEFFKVSIKEDLHL